LNYVEKAKEYAVVVYWDEEEPAYVARCLEISGCTGVNVDAGKAVQELYSNLTDHLQCRHEQGLSLPEPFERRHLRWLSLFTPTSLLQAIVEQMSSIFPGNPRTVRALLDRVLK